MLEWKMQTDSPLNDLKRLLEGRISPKPFNLAGVIQFHHNGLDLQMRLKECMTHRK